MSVLNLYPWCVKACFVFTSRDGLLGLNIHVWIVIVHKNLYWFMQSSVASNRLKSLFESWMILNGEEAILCSWCMQLVDKVWVFIDTRFICLAKQVLPDSIAGLEKLEELDVSSNLLVFLPDSIGLLRNLKFLNVSANKVKALPESIALCRWSSFLVFSSRLIFQIIGPGRFFPHFNCFLLFPFGLLLKTWFVFAVVHWWR